MSEKWISAEQMEYLKRGHDGKTCARLPYCTDCDLLARIAELERHQAEAAKAIRALENAGRVLSERLDEFEAALIGQRPGRVDADPDIFFFQETPESWQAMHALDSAQSDLDTAIQEHAAALPQDGA